jgi:hypothetical protein
MTSDPETLLHDLKYILRTLQAQNRNTSQLHNLCSLEHSGPNLKERDSYPLAKVKPVKRRVHNEKCQWATHGIENKPKHPPESALGDRKPCAEARNNFEGLCEHFMEQLLPTVASNTMYPKCHLKKSCVAPWRRAPQGEQQRSNIVRPQTRVISWLRTCAVSCGALSVSFALHMPCKQTQSLATQKT